MPITTANLPGADEPAPKPKPAPAKSGLAEAMNSTDPLVQKLLWDRGHRDGDGDAHMVASIDAELRKLGFDL